MVLDDFINAWTHIERVEGIRTQRRGDCVVVVLAIALEASYNEALELAREELDRKDRQGVLMTTLLKFLRENATRHIDFSDRKTCTFNQWYKNQMNREKTYLVLVKGHLFTIKNGILYGNDEDAKVSRKKLWAVYSI